MSKSALEDDFLLLFRLGCIKHRVRLPYPEREFRFAPPRKWRFDFAWPDLMVAVEIDGGIWSGGRHANPLGLIQQYDKQNAAQVRGWKVLRLSSQHLKNPDETFDLLLYALGALEVDA
jgi:very-short-patch-repair endonuclease